MLRREDYHFLRVGICVLVSLRLEWDADEKSHTREEYAKMSLFH